MKTLIIHPKDASTDFLKPIYKSVENAATLTGGVGLSKIKEYIQNSERVLMMGHGSPSGLFSIGRFNTGNYVIGDWCVDDLAQKQENVFIWCNADKFVTRYKLKGFYSGMFVSEVSEANFCGLNGVDQDMVDESNQTFAILLGEYINLKKHDIYNNIRDSYGKLAKNNPVAMYNWKRLYVA